jgi:hypothetical protein
MAHDLESIEQSDVHHEETDVDFRAVLQFGAALVVAALVIHAVVALLFLYFNGRQTDEMRFPLAAGAARLPPEPRLQIDPPAELRELRAGENEVLNGYRWVDRDAGTVRIPIGEAMRRVLERGLPAREAPGEPPR